MRLIQFLSAVNLFEAAKDRYTQMFTNLIPAFSEVGKKAEYEDYVNREIDWAMRTLKKQDKVIWYLRLLKVDIIEGQMQSVGVVDQYDIHGTFDNWAQNPEATEEAAKQHAERFKAMYDKAVQQLANKMADGYDKHSAGAAANQAVSPRFKQRMEHFMSLGIAALDEYVFANQSPEDILRDWTPIEDVWKSKREATIPIDRDGIDTLIEYPDGSEWVNLNKAYCQQEGEAMGHCGNGGSQDENDTVLSYRTIEDVDGEKLWKPRLTFILNRKTGLLGETKGRANQPPAEKYHNVIVDLLKHDFIKGIRGGGYMPENNFKLADLPEETQEALVEEKPGLASISFDYKKRGMTKQLLNRMEAMWEDSQLDFPEFKDNMFLSDTNQDLDEFLSVFGGDQAEWVAKILDGRDHLDIDLGGHAYYRDELFDSLPTKIQHQVGAWVIENYGDEVEEWKEDNDTDYDGTDASTTMTIVNENGIDEVTDALYRAEMTGHEYGAEHEMYLSLSEWLKDPPNGMEWDLSIHPDTTYEEEEQETRKVVFPVEVMIDILDNHLDSLEYEGSVPQLAEIKKLEAPYHGWQGYDEEAAKERAEEELYETGVLSNETP